MLNKQTAFVLGVSVLSVLLLTLFLVSPHLSANAYEGIARNPNLKAADAPISSTKLFLPFVAKNYLAPAPLWRFGTAQSRLDFSSYDPILVPSMRFGWYVDFNAITNAPQPYGIEYVPTIRVKQWKWTDSSHTTMTQYCVGCAYVGPPYTYTVSLNSSQIQSMATSRPGMTWVIGNEIERKDFAGGRQDEILPSAYAQAYHDIYLQIKAADPTAQVAIGSVVEPTSLRLQYLQQILNSYQSAYGQPMPIDVWNFHLYVLQEVPGSFGADIPAGISATSGALYTIIQNKDFSISGVQQVLALRNFMKQNGYQQRPLISTEYGVNFPDWVQCNAYPNTSGCPFTPEQVRDSFMNPSFNYFLNQTDASIGYASDGNRLVQRWNWYSFDYDDGQCVIISGVYVYVQNFNGNLFNSGLGPSSPPTNCNFPAKGMSTLGTYWKQYVQALPSGSIKPYAPVNSLEQVHATAIPPSVQSPKTDAAGCPVDRLVRQQFYEPTHMNVSFEGVSGNRVPNKSLSSPRMTSETTICLSAASTK